MTSHQQALQEQADAGAEVKEVWMALATEEEDGDVRQISEEMKIRIEKRGLKWLNIDEITLSGLTTKSRVCGILWKTKADALWIYSALNSGPVCVEPENTCSFAIGSIIKVTGFKPSNQKEQI